MPQQIPFYGTSDQTKSVATHEELFDFCNKVRRAGGGEVLDALLPGYVGNATQCLIAKNLNFDCYVMPFYKIVNGKEERQNTWCMQVKDHQVARAIAINLQLTVDVRFDGSKFVSVLILPEEIGNAADAFDRGLAFKNLDKDKFDYKNSLY